MNGKIICRKKFVGMCYSSKKLYFIGKNKPFIER